MPLHATVEINMSSDHDAAQLVHEFETVGLTVDLHKPGRRGCMGMVEFVETAVISVAYAELIKQFTADAYKGLKTLTRKLCDRAMQRNGSPRIPGVVDTDSWVVFLRDTASWVQIVLEADLPDDAYEQLRTLDLDTIRGPLLAYDRHRCQWGLEFDY